MLMSKQPVSTKKADQYNDPKHNYLDYWQGRDYEHLAEVMAIRRLLNGKHFKQAVDVGGGYGRLSKVLAEYADDVTLTEPSSKQLDIAKDFLKSQPKIKRNLGQADSLDFKDDSVDLLIMIRVMHHLPDPGPELAEIARVLAPKNGLAIIEVANYAHARNRVKYLLRGKKLPLQPVDIRSAANKRNGEVAFVNHNPHTVMKQLDDAGLKVERILSVSNLRSPSLKKLVPRQVLLAVEGILQPTLAKTFFGPSVFFLLSKKPRSK
jgi:ubiquinone/menaquinone biosynthesis C-methylase UbiE